MTFLYKEEQKRSLEQSGKRETETVLKLKGVLSGLQSKLKSSEKRRFG